MIKCDNIKLLLIIILICIVFIMLKKKENLSDQYSDKPGVIKQPLFHPWIFQNVQSDDLYHSFFSGSTNNLQLGRTSLAAQSI